MQPIEVKRIRVRKGALDLEVAAALDTLYVAADQASRMCDLLPNLASHVCVNDGGNDSFGDEIEGTELPHLLEHTMIELMGRAAHAADAPAAGLTGHTSWLEELEATAPQGYALMRVTVSFANDFLALCAMSYAVDIIEWACDPDACARPDVDEMVVQLAAA